MSDADRIADYGLIGDTRTAALVSAGGAIDWMCVPRFDGPSLFGRLVGGSAAGTFALGPARAATLVSRHYRRDTATLETTWQTQGVQLTLVDGLVAELGHGLTPGTVLVRQLSVDRGAADIRFEFDPRLGAERARPSVRRDRAGRLVCRWGATAVALCADRPIDVPVGRAITLHVDADDPLIIALGVAHREPLAFLPTEHARQLLDDDEQRWKLWVARIDRDVPYRDSVVRSLITLRLLTYSPSGAPIAAPTTSLPEALGGSRNWDYRYAWPRDASIAVGAFLGLGLTEEAERFMSWLLHASRLDRPSLPPLLTLHGKHSPPDRVLDGWPGYADSPPVRVGNTAGSQ